MHGWSPLTLALLVSVAILAIGLFYIASPARITGGFGLRAPAFDPTTRAWLRTKGVRDIASGLVVLVVLLTTGDRTTGIVVLVLASIPLGDMLNVIASGGSKSTALSVHGLTCLVMLFTGLLFLHAF